MEWLRHLFEHIGRPDAPPLEADHPTDASLSAVDRRLSDLERQQREILARIKLVEIQARIRGRDL
jgi:hypothetical protein